MVVSGPVCEKFSCRVYQKSVVTFSLSSEVDVGFGLVDVEVVCGVVGFLRGRCVEGGYVCA